MWNNKKLQKLLQLYESGLSLSVLASRYSLSTSTISLYLAKARFLQTLGDLQDDPYYLLSVKARAALDMLGFTTYTAISKAYAENKFNHLAVTPGIQIEVLNWIRERS